MADSLINSIDRAQTAYAILKDVRPWLEVQNFESPNGSTQVALSKLCIRIDALLEKVNRGSDGEVT